MNLGNWQRDLLRIALYVAGFVMLVTAIPDLVAYLMAYIDWEASWRQVGPNAYMSSGDARKIMQSLPLVAPTARAIIGLLLAWLSHWLSRKVFPDQPEKES